MSFQCTNPEFLWLLGPALAWVAWCFWKSGLQLSVSRRWVAVTLRVAVVLCLILAMAGLQWKKPREGVNVIFALDRSDSIPSSQQEAARKYVNQAAREKKKMDATGLLVFGAEAALESSPSPALDLNNTKILAVVEPQRTDLAAAVRLGTAAFPEHGQKRLVLMTDGHENLGDALAAVLAARPLGVSVDVVPLGVERGNDVSLQKIGVPNRVKKGQPCEVKMFVNADRPQAATLRLYRNEEYLGSHPVNLDRGKNLFTLSETLDQPGFYTYSAVIEAAVDSVPQNNRATSFLQVHGEPRVLIASENPEQDKPLLEALQHSKLDVKLTGAQGLPASLPELQSYDAIIICNLSAGELGEDRMKLLESAVRDFGVGLVCVGGDQAYTAGAYRGTPLEATLPLQMELDSRKVLPKGALVMLMHGMEFPNANEAARQTALAALHALGPQDELGVLLWDGNERWLFPLGPVGDRQAMGRSIAGMNQGDLPSFQNLMTKGYQALVNSKANLKHLIVFSDGDPSAPSEKLLKDIVAAKITVSTVMIGGHVQPDTMIWMADTGNGRFYDVPLNQAHVLPEIFLKESAVVLKAAIFEEPFKPVIAGGSELLRGIAPGAYPPLLGYVCAAPKARAEVPILSDKGDPILAHWQYGLGRAVAFTSDARARWAREWQSWAQFRQFWTQITQWSLRRVENNNFTSEVSVEGNEGSLDVEAVDEHGNYRNFLNLQAIVVSPRGDRQVVRLEQSGPGHYEVKFPTREVGAYVVNLLEWREGQPRGSQVLGASLNYSPEFAATEPNLSLLKRLAEYGGGRLIRPETPADNPFLHDREKTYQPYDFWETLLKLAIILFVLDVGVRRIMIDRQELLKLTATLRAYLFFWQPKPGAVTAEASLSALLARRDQVRTSQTAAGSPEQPDPSLFQPKSVPVAAAPPAATGLSPAPSAPPAAAPPTDPATAETSTTGRLLAAKRRARKKME